MTNPRRYLPDTSDATRFKFTSAQFQLMAREQNLLRWSSQFSVIPSQHTPRLSGDKIVLPQSALEQLLAAAPLQQVTPENPSRSYTRSFDPFNPHTFAAESQAREYGVDRQHQLPHPLTFRLVNPQNGRVISLLREALEIDDYEFASEGKSESDAPIITVHVKPLPKGTYVRLRPLEAGYDPEDWKALLERHLRENYTTLTTGEVLTLPGNREGSFRFLADSVEPEGEGICVVDTDLEVDIVALSEDQARETLRRRLTKTSHAPDTKRDTSVGRVLELGTRITGQVSPGEYVDYEVRKWDNGSTIEINLNSDDDVDISLLVSPFSTRQRNRPREDEFVFGELSDQAQKRITIASTNVELEGAEALYISVHAFASNDLSQQVGFSANVCFAREFLFSEQRTLYSMQQCLSQTFSRMAESLALSP
ncbi:hypothetical protein ASPSYDRAFT_430901 [Aspergillus sydowii CBS 593.65]|uniref:Uncharacterized protein n=1 Tax=Aspergillus sydowii CBS 593.65 TaxID=1036612 RepID=A0A1L9T8K8_9EURO|nr:uncharacterized protein ASPSYDRAFT_430901 [Aspergillus sydowii CBS 593.65]OJJ55778.1 hypothetical protein ASPSYDRAFT_430901 [Aspergillus sydowii CBS 593.65]